MSSFEFDCIRRYDALTFEDRKILFLLRLGIHTTNYSKFLYTVQQDERIMSRCTSFSILGLAPATTLIALQL